MRAVPQSKISRTFRSAVSRAFDKRDYVEDLAANSQTELAKLTQNRKWLLTAVGLGLLATAVVWIVAWCFPYDVADIYSLGVNSNLPRYGTLVTVLLMSVPFAPPFISVFALSHLIFPSPAPREIASGLMSTFEYRQKSSRQTLIFIVAGMAGAVNCLLLLIVLTTLNGH